ncbi:isoform 2 of kyphoscoliosis peptidase [Aspergillus udagawae]|nr:isoform 2 of kyphoscoliosis peptidase [Aspergillus udagawae]
MAEETPVLTIQERIKALKQAQESRPSSFRAKTINIPPVNGHGSVIERSVIGNEPAAPPTLASKPSITQKPKAPPPLPTRKASNQQLVPALPPRRPSVNSIESVASDTSRSTVSTGVGRPVPGRSSSSSESGNVRTVRAPRYDEAELPVLPPRREEAKSPEAPPRPKPTTTQSRGSLPPPLPSIREPPSLHSARPALPIRRASSNINLKSGDAAPRPPPRLPSRDRQGQSQSAECETRPARKLPPPLPSGSALGKLQLSGFGGLNKTAPSAVNGAPPPVPIASRPEKPDLSKLLATKPRVQPNTTTADSTAMCLKCRDFSGPDSHAARFPRETLPTHDLAWLARELTAPFPSPTDKARALFTWCHHNICYDADAFFNSCVKPSTPASTLASGVAVCEGYAGLFAALATHAGLEAIVIGGHGKGYGYEPLGPGQSIPPYRAGHAWNAVRIDNGQWKLIDVCWGAGVVQGPGQPYQKLFNPTLFTMTNEEFSLKHFPEQRYHFDCGRQMSWEEYITMDPEVPFGIEQPKNFDLKSHFINERSFLPAAKQISVYQPGPLRFQFGLTCEHFTLERHGKVQPSLFLLWTHGLDGRKDELIPFTYVRGSGPEFWYIDLKDPRTLGAPGQKLQIVALTEFNDRKDCRGISAEEYKANAGRVRMAFAFVAEWPLV